MRNISWCPCLKVRVNFLPRRNYAAHFTVPLLTNYRRADESSDSLEEEQETKSVGELVRPKEVSQHQGGQENVCGAVLCNLVLQMIILEKKPNSLNV